VATFRRRVTHRSCSGFGEGQRSKRRGNPRVIWGGSPISRGLAPAELA
jgi:hypothetical protein